MPDGSAGDEEVGSLILPALAPFNPHSAIRNPKSEILAPPFPTTVV